MKKTLISTCIVFIALALFSSTAFSWGVATHAYIGKKLGNQFGYLNLQEMYGAMAPDIPWIMFDLPKEFRDALGDLTHEEFRRVADVAWWRSQKAFAYGFASHNEIWGADYWAHDTPGYAKLKVQELMAWYPSGYPDAKSFWDWVDGLGKESGFKYFVAEAAIEHAIDILVKQKEDPTIGLSMFLSAWLRSPGVPWLLVKAYAADWEASLIMAAEKEFRQTIMLYGSALLQEDPVAAVAEIAATQFGYLIETVPPVSPPNPEELKDLAIVLIEAAMYFCENIYPTYSEVLNDTTIEHLENKLAAEGIETYIPWKWWR